MKNHSYVYRSNAEYFYDVMEGRKPIITEEDQDSFNASYFGMCFLLPEESFLQQTTCLGGLKAVKKDDEKKTFLARTYRVEKRLVDVRVSDLLSRQQQAGKQQNPVKMKQL